MNNLPERSGLTFFGAVSASISHELKNRFAIVNEQVGLLKDLVFMAERSGGDPDPELDKVISAVSDLLKDLGATVTVTSVPPSVCLVLPA